MVAQFAVILRPPAGSVSGRVDKAEIGTRILSATENDGGLRAVKHIYATRRVERRSLLDIIFVEPRLVSDARYYSATDTLAYILEDIRTEKILEKNTTKESLTKLDHIISEHAAVNPFEALERNQKDYFDAIRQKTGDQYANIKADIEKLVDEVAKKNELVQKYLADSTLSLRLTYLALVLTLIIGGWQIFQAWPSKQRRMLREVLGGDETKASQ